MYLKFVDDEFRRETTKKPNTLAWPVIRNFYMRDRISGYVVRRITYYYIDFMTI